LLVLSLGIGLFCFPGKRAERSDQLDHENAELKSLGALPVIGSGDLDILQKSQPFCAFKTGVHVSLP
jgi:hypothetical protein